MWFNEGKPANTSAGDLEDMSVILARNPTTLCRLPYSCQAQSINSPTTQPSGQWLLNRPDSTLFLISYKSLAPLGVDFRVRYCCSNGSFTPPTVLAVVPLSLDSSTCGKQAIAPRAKAISRIYGGTDAIANSWPWVSIETIRKFCYSTLICCYRCFIIKKEDYKERVTFITFVVLL